MAIRFNKHHVTDSMNKARVTYSTFRMASSGRDCVTLYPKDYDSGRALARMFASDEYENATDIQSDYFEKGRVRLLTDSPHYAAALARCT